MTNAREDACALCIAVHSPMGLQFDSPATRELSPPGARLRTATARLAAAKARALAGQVLPIRFSVIDVGGSRPEHVETLSTLLVPR